MAREAPSLAHRRRGWIVVSVAVALVIASAFAWPTPPRPDSSVVVIFPPWMPRQTVVEAVARDGIHILDTGVMPNLVFISADDTHALAGLYRAGAWSVFGVDRFWGCFGGADRDGAAGAGSAS